MNQASWNTPHKLLYFLLPIYKFKISGNSMLPTFKESDVILVNRFAYWFAKPQIDDIIAIHDPRDGKVLIKRIIKTEQAKYFVQGDNLNYSSDSRLFGMIDKTKIIGKVLLRNEI